MASKKELEEIKGISQSINKSLGDGLNLSKKRTEFFKKESSAFNSISSKLKTIFSNEQKINSSINSKNSLIDQSRSKISYLITETKKLLGLENSIVKKLNENNTIRNNSEQISSVNAKIKDQEKNEKKITQELKKQKGERQEINKTEIKTPEIKTQSFESINVLSDQFNKILSGASKLTDDITKDTDGTNKKLSEQIGFTQSILSNIKSEEDIKDAINNLEKQKTDISKTNLGVNEKHKEGYLAIVESIKEGLTKEQSRIDVLNKVEKTTNAVTKSMTDGLDNLVGQIEEIPVVGKVFKKLIPVDKLKNNIKSIGNNFIGGFTNSFNEVRAAGGSFSKSFSSGMKAGFRSIGPSLTAVFANPLGLAIGLFALVAAAGVLAFYKISEAAKQFRQETGLLISQTPNLEKNINQAYINTVGLGASMEEVTQSATAFTREFKNLQQPSQQTLESIVALSKNFGVMPETAAQVTKLIHDMTGATADQAQHFTNNVALLSQMAGVAPQQVMDDIANSSEESYKYFGGSEKALLKAGIFAAKMGTSIKKMSESAKGLLDFESSITDQMEASAILGRNLNLNQARYFAMTGKIPEMHEAIGREVDKIGDITKLNVFQQEALAKATGVPFKDLVEQQKIRKKFGKLSAEELAAVNKQIEAGTDIKNITRDQIQLQADEIKKQQEMQSEFDRMGNELKKIGASLLQSLMPVGKAIMAILVPMLSYIQGGFTLVGKSITRLVDAAKSVIQPFSDLFGGGEGKGFAKTMEFIGKVMYSIVGFSINYVAGLIKGLGHAISSIVNTVKGFINVFKGIFTLNPDVMLKGLKQIGSGFGDFVMSILELFRAVPMAFIRTLMDIFPGVESFVNAIKEKFVKIKDNVVNALKPLKDVFYSAFQKLQEPVERLKKVFEEKIVPPFKTAISKIQEIIARVKESFSGLFSGDGGGEGFKKTMEFVAKILGGVIVGAFTFIANVISGIANILSGVVDIVKGIFTLDFGLIGDGLKSIFSGLLDFIMAVPRMLWDGLTYIFPNLATIGTKIWEGIKNIPMMLVERIKNILSGLVDIVKGIFTLDFGLISDGLKSSFSAWFDGIMTIPRMLWNGLTSIFPNLATIGTQIWEGIKNIPMMLVDGILTLGQKINEFFGGIPGMFVEKIMSIGDRIKNFFMGLLPNWVQGLLGGGKSDASNIQTQKEESVNTTKYARQQQIDRAKERHEQSVRALIESSPAAMTAQALGQSFSVSGTVATNANGELVAKINELITVTRESGNKPILVDGERLTNSVTNRQQRTSTNRFNTLGISN